MARKASIRNWMEATRECVNAKGPFSANNVATKHRISKGFSTSLREMGYTVRGPKRCSVWDGERPTNEQELLKMTRRIMKYSLERHRVIRKRNVTLPTGVDAEPRQEIIQLSERRVSILWGLLSFTY